MLARQAHVILVRGDEAAVAFGDELHQVVEVGLFEHVVVRIGHGFGELDARHLLKRVEEALRAGRCRRKRYSGPGTSLPTGTSFARRIGL